MSFFGLQIGSPIAATSKPQQQQLTEAHNLIGWAIIVLAAGHAAAALYHHFRLKDQVLERMLPRGRVQIP
jgi:cytochrome b561